MPQRSIRFPDELHAAIEAEAAARDRSFSYVVLDAVRCQLRMPATVQSEAVDIVTPNLPRARQPVAAPENGAAAKPFNIGPKPPAKPRPRGTK